jgi:curved DNA-binding protein
MAVHFKDYYQVLGVAKTASQGEIRKAFRALARQHHPDVAKDKKAAEGRFKEINEAYEVLGDAERRKKYDELGQDWDRGARPNHGPHNGGGMGGFGAGPGGFGGHGFSDFFETFFGAGPTTVRKGSGGRRQRGFSGAPSPQDIEGEVNIRVEEFFSGVRKRVRVQRSSGVSESIEVGIPAGIGVGQKVRVAGKGEHGGDVLLRVELEPQPDLYAEGEDLVCRLRVPVWGLVLGTESEVRTPDGVVRMKIPAGIQADQRLRVRERGLPRRGGGRGDFYVQVVAEVPRELAGEERACWERLRALDAAKDLQTGR